MRSKELLLVHENDDTVKLDLNGFPWNENLQRKKNWTVKKMQEKSMQFLSSEQPWQSSLLYVFVRFFALTVHKTP